MYCPESLTSWVLILTVIFYLPFVVQGLVCWIIITVTGKRVHYIEIHEESWCPQWLRDTLLVQLQGGWYFYGITKIYGGLSPGATMGDIMSDILFANEKESQYEQMTMLLDTCSGASGPTHIVHSQLYKRFQMYKNRITKTKGKKEKMTPFCTILSDLWPYVESWQSLSNQFTNLGYIPVSTDATDVKITKDLVSNKNCKDLLTKNGTKVLEYAIESRVINNERWLRSLFCGFHHLRPLQAQSVIYDTIKNGDGLIIAEKMHQRRFLDLIKWPPLMTLSAPIKWMYNVYDIYIKYQSKLKRKKNEHNSQLLVELIINLIVVTIVQPLCVIVFMHDACTSAARTYLLTECEEMFTNGLHKVAIEKGMKQGSKEYLNFMDSYEFRAWIQPTLMPKPWCNMVKLTCFSVLPKKQNN